MCFCGYDNYYRAQGMNPKLSSMASPEWMRAGVDVVEYECLYFQCFVQ